MLAELFYLLTLNNLATQFACFAPFLPRRYASAVYAMDLCLSVCLSVCLLEVGVLPKRINLGSANSTIHWIAQRL